MINTKIKSPKSIFYKYSEKIYNSLKTGLYNISPVKADQICLFIIIQLNEV